MRSRALRSLLPFYRGSDPPNSLFVEHETATLIAIAKNESAYILEWIAHHLAVGFSRIIVIDNESTDGTLELLERIASACPELTVKTYSPVCLHESPQVTAYTEALKDVETRWTMFLDIDEFLIPFRDYSIELFLARVPADVSSVHINWRGFGSGGRVTADYEFVVEAFTRCAPHHWGNHHHFKSIARTSLIESVHIHNVKTTSGRRVLSDFSDFETVHNGMSDRIVYGGIQINHYQSKTYVEFKARMERGDANYHPEHLHKVRDSSYERFVQLDVNEEENDAAIVFRARFGRLYDEIRQKCL